MILLSSTNPETNSFYCKTFLTRMGFNYFFLSLSLLLFVGCNISAQGPSLPPCNVSGETRLIPYQNSSFPQICIYINTNVVNTNLTVVSGYYYIFMCYAAGWGSENREVFCPVGGYTGHQTRPERLSIPNVGVPKYTNVTCNGDENTFLSCSGGEVITSQCDYVYDLYCTPCTTASDCLGGSNSMCSMGLCRCIGCANGACYAGGCLCNQGWEGDTCAQRICVPECENGGVCQDNATCSCPFPYTGPNCLMNLTCNPGCLNGGQCVADFSISTFRCSCTQGYGGSQCQSLLTTPTQNPTTVATDQAENTTSVQTTVAILPVSIGDLSYVLIISILIPVLCCIGLLVIILIVIVCLFVCFTVLFMKRNDKNDTQLKASGFENISLNPYDLERKDTIYTAVDEAAMIDHATPPALPPENKNEQYEVMRSQSLEKKTSIYEIEDPVLEKKTFRHKLTEKQTVNKVITEDLREGSEYSNNPEERKDEISSPAESPYLALLGNSKSQEPTAKAYSNPSIVDDSNA